mgnify:CR=1 FL=1
MYIGVEEQFNAEQNAEVVVSGEEYYRKLYSEQGGGNVTWNTRDQHMVHTLLRLVEYQKNLQFMDEANTAGGGEKSGKRKVYFSFI